MIEGCDSENSNEKDLYSLPHASQSEVGGDMEIKDLEVLVKQADIKVATHAHPVPCRATHVWSTDPAIPNSVTLAAARALNRRQWA